MDFKKIKIIASFLIVLLVSACGDAPCIRGCSTDWLGNQHCTRECPPNNHTPSCYDADDWGFPKVYVPAGYSINNPALKGDLLNQYVDGIDSGQILLDANVAPLVVTIGRNNKWTSWFGGDINTNDDGTINPNGFDSGRSVIDRECDYNLVNGPSSPSSTFASDLSPQTGPTGLTDPKTGIAFSCNDPNLTPDHYELCKVTCYYKNGMGLYIGLAPNNGSSSSPNDVLLSYHIPDAKVPDGHTKYVNDNTKTAAENYQLSMLADVKDGYLIRGTPATEIPGVQTGDRLYFKIVDRAYIDNSGGYLVKIKEGTRRAALGPIEQIVSVFIDPINAVMVRIYNGIVNNTTFIRFIQALLGLYVAFFGYTIMIGGTEELKKDVFVRLFKVGTIMTLISPNSWQFFHDYLFVIFLQGTHEIAATLLDPFGDIHGASPWYAMDDVLAKLWSQETWAKIASTLFSNSVGLIFIPAMAWGILMFMIALVKALIIYLVMFASIAILLTLAPIFLMFMLFERTKDITKEWFDQLFVAALQQIILMAALGMFAAIIVMYLQKTVGYHVCWNVWLPNFFGYDFKFWMPDISGDKSNIWMDANGDGIRAANEMAYRYIDAPYLDIIYDKVLLSKVLSEHEYVSIIDLIFFVGSILLMKIFMGLVPIIANTLKSGTAGQSANMFGAGSGLISAFNSAIRGDGKGGGLLGGSISALTSKDAQGVARFVGRVGIDSAKYAADTRAGKAAGDAATGAGKAAGYAATGAGKAAGYAATGAGKAAGYLGGKAAKGARYVDEISGDRISAVANAVSIKAQEAAAFADRKAQEASEKARQTAEAMAALPGGAYASMQDMHPQRSVEREKAARDALARISSSENTGQRFNAATDALDAVARNYNTDKFKEELRAMSPDQKQALTEAYATGVTDGNNYSAAEKANADKFAKDMGLVQPAAGEAVPLSKEDSRAVEPPSSNEPEETTSSQPYGGASKPGGGLSKENPDTEAEKQRVQMAIANAAKDAAAKERQQKEAKEQEKVEATKRAAAVEATKLGQEIAGLQSKLLKTTDQPTKDDLTKQISQLQGQLDQVNKNS